MLRAVFVKLLLLAFVVGAQPAFAQEIPTPDESSIFIFNSFLFLICGMVVMFMAAGFCMLEVGLVRSKNAGTICLKNIALFSIAGIMVWLTGYNIIYGGPGNHLLTPLSDWFIWQPDSMAKQFENGYSGHADWYFQMVFVATAASIVSGTLAERVKLWPFLIFVAILTGIIYPIQASWEWGEGYLDATWNFSDFAGSSLVHATGGWAALAGAIILGPRTGKFLKNRIDPMPGSSLPLATLGTFILWLGWFGFNGGSQLAGGTVEDIAAVGQIFVNTNISAAAGVLGSMILSSILYKKVDLTIALNGAIGGLVSITAEPLMPAIWQAAVIGSVGGVIVTLAIPVLYRFKIDDVVGAIPAHLFCGIWGTMIVVWTNNASTTAENPPTFLGQLVGVLMIGTFVFFISSLVWLILKYTIGIRVDVREEMQGLDLAELGQEAYPEFTAGR